MITFPSNLPAPSQDFTMSPGSNSVRTKMDSGRTRQRRTHLYKEYQAQVVWEFTDNEFTSFKGFLAHEAFDGSAWFHCPIFTGGVVKEHKIRLVDGTYEASYQSWFGWVVRATVDIDEIAIPSFSLYIWSIQQQPFKIKNLLHEAVNIHFPNSLQGIK